MATAYAVLADIPNYGVSAAALAPISASAQQAALDGAADLVDSFLRSQFRLPLVQWGADIKRAVCILAAADILISRGLDPTHAGDPIIMQRRDEVMVWLRMIAEGKATPNVTDSSAGAAPGVKPAGPRVVTSSPRGWSNRGGDPSQGGGFIGD